MNKIQIIFLFLLVIIPINSTNSTIQSKTINEEKLDWIMSVNTNLVLINSSMTKLFVTFNYTYLNSVIADRWSEVGYFEIKSQSKYLFSWYPEMAYIHDNFTLDKGSHISDYSFIFATHGDFITTNLQTTNIPILTNTTNDYTFNFSINPQFPAYTGSLNISVNPTLNVILSPLTYNEHGSLQVNTLSNQSSSITTSSISNTESSSNSPTNLLSTNQFDDLVNLLLIAFFMGLIAVMILTSNQFVKYRKEKSLNNKNNESFYVFIKKKMHRHNVKRPEHPLVDEPLKTIEEILEESK